MVEPKLWPMHCRWWFRDKEIGQLPCDPYSRRYYLSVGYRPDHSDLYEGGYAFEGRQWKDTFEDGVSPVFRGEKEPPEPRAIDMRTDTALATDRIPTLIERIRVAIFDEKQVEIEGTAQELAERFGYQEPAQFGRDMELIRDNLIEFGIDIERTRTPKKRWIRIYENKENPYHPLQQAHLI